MPKVKFFTLIAKAAGSDGYESRAPTVKALLEEIRELHGEEINRYLDACIVLVNGTNIGYLKGARTKLEDDDLVSIFPPVAGG